MKGRYEDQKKARELRSQGYTIKEICELVNASKSSVSGWVKDVVVSGLCKKRLENKQNEYSQDGRLKKAQEKWVVKCKTQREVWRNEGYQKAQLNDPLHILGCSLYWAEGAKDRNHFCFANSDSQMMKKMIDFLFKYFDINENELVGRIAFYESEGVNEKSMEAYWQNIIGRKIRWWKHVVNPYNKNKVPEGERKNHVNKLRAGVCTIKILKSTKIVQHIFGALEYYGSCNIDP